MSARHRIDGGFEAWGRWVHRHRGLVLALCLLSTAATASFLPQMRVESSETSYLHGDDPAARVYDAFQRQFGQDDRILLALEPPEIFDPAFLERLEALHRDLEARVPHVAEVESLVNARETRGEGDTLVVGELLERWRREGGDLAELRRRVFANPLYLDHLISRDGRIAALGIEPVVYSGAGDAPLAAALEGFGEPAPDADAPPFLSEGEKRAMVAAIEEQIARHVDGDFPVHLVGGPVLSRHMNQLMTADVKAYLAAAVTVIALFLLLLFRRFSGVAFPLAVVVAALVGNLGTMVWLDIPFSVVLGMLPVFTTCVGVCNAVHVLVLVYRRLAEGDPREDAIAYAFGHSGLAMLMTSLTTACGMLSFLTAELAPIRDLGVTAPFGVLYAYVYTMTLLPALIGVMPPRRSVGRRRGPGWAEKLLVGTGDLATRHAPRVLAGGAVVLGVSLLGIARLGFTHDPIAWFPEDDPIRRAFAVVDQRMGGATSTEVQIETGRENGLHDPDVLRRIEAAMREAEALERGPIRVSKAISLVDIAEETHQALNGNDPAFHALPASRELIAQELLLFENSGSDDLEPISDAAFSTARMTLRVPLVDAVLYADYLAELESRLTAILGDDLPFTITGRTVIQGRTFTALIESMLRSYGFALLVITPLMIALVGNLRLGLISMVPNLFPVFVTLGLMGLLGIDIDASNVVLGSIIIGLAVDDTIHFLHRFKRDFERSGNTRAAVHETMATTGSALFFTSLVLATGFATMGALGSLGNTIAFGFLSAFGISVAFVADVLLTPALVAVSAGLGSRRRDPRDPAPEAVEIEAGAVASPSPR